MANMDHQAGHAARASLHTAVASITPKAAKMAPRHLRRFFCAHIWWKKTTPAKKTMTKKLIQTKTKTTKKLIYQMKKLLAIKTTT